MTDKAINKTIESLKDSIKNIQQNPTVEQVNKFNSQLLGKHTYYNMATHISEDFGKINFLFCISCISLCFWYNENRAFRNLKIPA
jgi:hypothetical protein